mgnify:CR=1 FL=1
MTLTCALVLIIASFRAASALKRLTIPTVCLIFSELTVSLCFNIRVKFILNRTIRALNLQEHGLGKLISGVQIWMELLSLVKVRLLDFFQFFTSRDAEQEVRIFELFFARVGVDGETHLALIKEECSLTDDVPRLNYISQKHV